MNDFKRITQNPQVMGGKPCIRGMRVTVGVIVGQIAPGSRSRTFLRITPIPNARTFLRRPVTPRGEAKNVRSN
jgi:uncharacterized protein DUF433